MKILDFDLEGSHFIIEAGNSAGICGGTGCTGR